MISHLIALALPETHKTKQSNYSINPNNNEKKIDVCGFKNL